MISFLVLSLLLYVGYLLRTKVPLLQWLYLPSAVIAGLVGLAAIQISPAAGLPVPEDWTLGWDRLPGLLIDVVFACLFLGTALPGLRSLWRRAGPQLAYGQVVAWGQYVVGVGLVLVALGPLFGVPAMFGGLIPVGFEGGHGTAGGLAQTFADHGWPEGKDLALASATVGVTSAIVVGLVLINWAARRGRLALDRRPEALSGLRRKGIIPPGERPSAGTLTVSPDAIGALTFQLVVVAVAVLIGYLLKAGLVGLEGLVHAGMTEADRHVTGFYIMVRSFPRFPLCMVGGLAVQFLEDRFDRHNLVDAGLMRRIQNTALDFLVVAAIATIRIEVLVDNFWPFLIIVLAAIAWNVFCVLVLARRMLPDAWFERSIAEMGQSMGVTATGLLLLRVVDPDYETPAAGAFAAKQLLHEPFMGGGLWTSTAIPLLALWGGPPVFLIACAAVAFWLALTFVPRRLRRARPPGSP